MKNKKVVIGMSGGVDSSTSAYLLKKAGYDLYGVTLAFDPKAENKDFQDAEKICKTLGIPHRIVDMSQEFESTVVDYFISEYSSGATPSPCIVCDEKVKFKILFQIAEEIGAEYVATGHYAKVNKNSKLGDISLLEVAADPRKDQSYMLYRIKPEYLKRLLFPLYNYNKTQVREIAKELGVMVYEKPDSQGICFAKEGYIPYLKRKLGDKIQKGNFILKDGTVLGQHEGYQLYTIGQRRGLGILLSRAYFITKIDPIKNEITLGEYDELMRDTVLLGEFSLNIDKKLAETLTYTARPRFSSLGIEGNLIFQEDKVFFKFHTLTPQNAPGQHLVLYYENFLVGGGKIIF